MGCVGMRFGTCRPPKNDTLTRRAVQQAMAGVGGIFWGAYRYHISQPSHAVAAQPRLMVQSTHFEARSTSGV